MKEKEDSETDCHVLESDDDQSAGNGEWVVLFYTFYFTHVIFL